MIKMYNEGEEEEKTIASDVFKKIFIVRKNHIFFNLLNF